MLDSEQREQEQKLLYFYGYVKSGEKGGVLALFG